MSRAPTPARGRREEIALLDLTQAPGHLIRRAQQVHARLWALEIEGELTSPQFAVLTTLAAEGPLDQGTIADLVSLDRSTMADVARRLERRGLVDRVRDPDDARRLVLSLTRRGSALLAQTTPQVETVSRRLLGGLSVQERLMLIDLLREVTEHGERLVAEHDPGRVDG